MAWQLPVFLPPEGRLRCCSYIELDFQKKKAKKFVNFEEALALFAK
jgi:hypothetical protein